MRRTALMFILAGLTGALVAVPVAVYAGHQFTDVPNTNPFHDDISWLADAEVTLGCGPNAYCPKDFVTREQMAAFMRRLAENQVVDAGTLEGMDADDLANGSASSVLAGTVNHDATETTGDITDADWNGSDYLLTFDGEDLDLCSAAITPGLNTGVFTTFVDAYGHVFLGDATPDMDSDQAMVRFNAQTGFHIVIVCP